MSTWKTAETFIFVNVFEGATDDYPVEKVWLYPKGCPGEDCLGCVWMIVGAITVPSALIDSMPVPDRP